MRVGDVVRIAAGLTLLGALGCSGAAHYVQKQADRCVVGIPADSNAFPTYYRDQADELAKKQFPQGFVFERGELVQIGTVTNTRTDTDAAHVGPFMIDQVSNTTTTSHPLMEYRVTYRPK